MTLSIKYAERLAWELKDVPDDHFDDMSEEILNEFWRVLHNRRPVGCDTNANVDACITKLIKLVDTALIQYDEIDCSGNGCNSSGKPNYGDLYYCGGSPRCIP